MRRESMRFLRCLAPIARLDVRHRRALQKTCCTEPRSASSGYGDLVMMFGLAIGNSRRATPIAVRSGPKLLLGKCAAEEARKEVQPSRTAA